MTTIAINKDKNGNYIIAADTLQVGEYKHFVKCKKIFKIQVDGEYLVVCGAGFVGSINAFLEWVKNGRDQDCFPELDEEGEYLVVSKEGVFSYENYPVELGTPAVAGSGGAFAMGTMLAGKSPKAAVEIAMRVDQNTGGEVEVLRIGT